MRQAEVLYNGEKAGILTEHDDRTFSFRYDERYFLDTKKPMISITLPKSRQEYHSDHLFSFFFNLLAEGANLSLQSRYLKIDKRDHFGILCQTAQHDTIGPITVIPLES